MLVFVKFAQEHCGTDVHTSVGHTLLQLGDELVEADAVSDEALGLAEAQGDFLNGLAHGHKLGECEGLLHRVNVLALQVLGDHRIEGLFIGHLPHDAWNFH